MHRCLKFYILVKSVERDITEQNVRQDVLTLRMDLAVKHNATVLTKTVIMSADVCSQQKVIHCVYNYNEKT